MLSPITIQVPASKSICNRILIMNALAENPSPIEHLSDCDDTQILLQTLRFDTTHFDIGAAGTAMRFLTAFLAQKKGEWTITGSKRMKQRPIGILVDALRAIGANISYLGEEGFPPLHLVGTNLQGGNLVLNGSVSSQYISALMMIAPYMQKGLHIELQGKIVSQLYIEMTAALMRYFGVQVDICLPHMDIKPQKYFSFPYAVESDWSGASYWYEYLSVVGEGTFFLPYFSSNSLQGDSRVSEIFTHLGVQTIYQNNGILISANGDYTHEFCYDFLMQPDLAQSVVVACCLRNIPFRFSGLQTLKIKETDRIAALIAELSKLGFVLSDDGNGVLSWNGTRCAVSEPISIKTYDDHRMAMAFAVAKTQMALTIENPEVVSKSYPHFWEEYEKVIHK